MTTRTVTAMFNSRAEAASAAQRISNELGVSQSAIRTSPETGATDTGYDATRPYEESGFFASIKNLFLPDEDRYAYAEGMRRGGVLVSATVDESQVDRAADILEHAGAVDLDQQETTWRQSGWTGYDAAAHGRVTGGTGVGSSIAGAVGGAAAAVGNAASRATNALTGDSATRPGYSPAAASTATPGTGGGLGVASVGGATAGGVGLGRDEVIQVVEERLVVGKREVDRGRVRVRSYVVERPVEEQVSLHEERVEVERRAVNRPLTDADRNAAFQERVIEATATSEEAVVGKEARIVEEIDIHKEAADRTETVRDTVRKTEVEVEDDAATARTGVKPSTTGNPARRV